jgi:hypothetical protein
MAGDLPREVERKVVELSRAGDEFVGKKSFRSGLEKYLEALELIPEPLTDWKGCAPLLAAVGNANYLAGAYDYAARALSDAMHCPGAIGTPFIPMRLGQAQFELGNMERAADELARAYLLEGTKLFRSEDPKYLAFIKSKLKPPPGGWPEGW